MEEKFTLKYHSNCKINLGLKVLNKRQDGFHNLASIFSELNLHDTITFKKSDKFQFSSNINSLTKISDNTIIQAYDLLEPLSKVNESYSIHLLKQIPMGSGLGGGSSNAATVLKTLNKLWNIDLPNSELINIGKKIGSDVPFFISGGNQYVEGVGDILSPLNDTKLSSLSILLVYPKINIETHWAYQSLKKGLEEPKTYNKFLDFNGQVNWQLLNNDFENVVFSTYPEIGAVKQKLISRKVLYAGLSGSGSTVYGIFANKSDAFDASKLFSSYSTYIASPIA